MQTSEQSISSRSSQQFISQRLRQQVKRSSSNYSQTSISKHIQNNDQGDDQQQFINAMNITSSLRLLQRNIEKRMTKKISKIPSRQLSKNASTSKYDNYDLERIQQFGTEYEELKNDFQIIKDFDLMKDFNNYFPHYNVTTVLSEIKRR